MPNYKPCNSSSKVELRKPVNSHLATVQILQPPIYAVVPATGRGSRFAAATGGQNKLLAKVSESHDAPTVIGRLLSWLKQLPLTAVFVSRTEQDAALREEVARFDVEQVLLKLRPDEMRHSVQEILSAIEHRFSPPTNAGWMLIPSDHFPSSLELGQRLCTHWRKCPDRIVAPSFEGKSGHPAIFPWSLVVEVRQLPENFGVNQLQILQANRVELIPVDESTILRDVNLPTDRRNSTA